MKIDTYNEIIETIKDSIGAKVRPWREVDYVVGQRFPNVSEDTLGSIYSLEYQKKMKKNHQKFSKTGERLYARYLRDVNAREKRGILIRMSESIDLSSALLARIVLEQYQEEFADEDEASKHAITKLMKDTTLIKDKDLAYEIYMCVIHDDQYGPITDCIKHSVGQEYELRLQRMVKNANIPFKDEEQLRLCGYDKTPDVKLELPIAVDGFVVNWIESKALFGDEANHKTYVKEQYLSYWNRFGPGLVIYWFGFVDMLEYIGEKKFIIRDTFPSAVTLMNPKNI